MSRRFAWFLVALCGWTLWVWGTRIWIISGQHHDAGFVVVHDTLAAVSIAFGLVAGYVGVSRLRRSPPREQKRDSIVS